MGNAASSGNLTTLEHSVNLTVQTRHRSYVRTMRYVWCLIPLALLKEEAASLNLIGTLVAVTIYPIACWSTFWLWDRLLGELKETIWRPRVTVYPKSHNRLWFYGRCVEGILLSDWRVEAKDPPATIQIRDTRSGTMRLLKTDDCNVYIDHPWLPISYQC